MAKSTRTETIFLVAAVLGILLVSSGATLYFSGSLTSATASGDEPGLGYQTVTLTDAQVECEKYARAELGSRIKALAVDTHSTRFDSMDKRYKVFFIAELYDSGDRKGVTKSFHVNCLTRGERATVAQFSIAEDKEQKTKAIQREEGGVFGWPL
ncbi:hypothetical protein FKG94_24125 [Exilibacterium tricleocarpae]|uniref:Uncharacterized protein n=1 Tax=Exilibacterium tricleocarpae TaxID=2591008 RepID=A0A545STB6_9GAMM|nr:hypothetical protein [Exilibacterium tricleocarpae]TQV68175.1 hypothetical protein FKG94_24125 [Exilibacterium tricleocarpae]